MRLLSAQPATYVVIDVDTFVASGIIPARQLGHPQRVRKSFSSRCSGPLTRGASPGISHPGSQVYQRCLSKYSVSYQDSRGLTLRSPTSGDLNHPHIATGRCVGCQKPNSRAVERATATDRPANKCSRSFSAVKASPQICTLVVGPASASTPLKSSSLMSVTRTSTASHLCAIRCVREPPHPHGSVWRVSTRKQGEYPEAVHATTLRPRRAGACPVGLQLPKTTHGTLPSD